MPCLRCGGIERTPLAARYWRCTTTVTERETVMRPAPVGPGRYDPINFLLLLSLRGGYPSILGSVYGGGPPELDPFLAAHSDTSIINMLRQDLDPTDFNTLVAYGLHQDTTIIRVLARDVRAQLARPTVQLVPVTVVRDRVCGHDYQDGPATDTVLSCECGYFAVGRCKECARPVCGTHSTLRSDRLLCREHLRAVESAEAAAVAEAEARAVAEREAQKAAEDEARRKAAGMRACIWLKCARRGQPIAAITCPECGTPTEPVARSG